MNSKPHSNMPGWLLPFLGLLLLLLLFLNKLAFSNLILARGDTFLYFYPYWNAAAEALRAWRIPLWNPSIFMGAPLMANSQMGFFYPLNWPFWLLLDTPYAFSASIILHLFIAAWGTYLVGRRVMGLGRGASFVSAFTFALGAYLTAQVEHINQVQGLSWLPWLLVVIAGVGSLSWRNWLRHFTAAALLLSLQLLAGHTQTTFISLVALFVWIVSQYLWDRFFDQGRDSADQDRRSSFLPSFTLLAAGGFLALLLTAVQLLPTLELTHLSSRQGGLPVSEVLSFSLHPLLLSRSLLPGYGQSLFSEYVAYLPLTILALGAIGSWQWRKRLGVFPTIVWILLALLLALGAFNPLNWLLAHLPGFNLFRAQARWLVVYALAAALLAGVGWQTLIDSLTAKQDIRGKDQTLGIPSNVSSPLLLFLILFLLLAVWGFAAGWLANIIPMGPEAPFEAPSPLTVLMWVGELFLVLLLIFLLYRLPQKNVQRLILLSILVLATVTLFFSTRTQPYNNLTTPEAFFDLRPAPSRLMVETTGSPQRFLSLSDIFFDPGDKGEIDSIYADQLSASAQYDYTIAVKQKEIAAPNLPMIIGLASVDGFDGGILPLQAYSEQMRLILPDGIETTDGRLREHLKEVPDARWLDLFHTRYLVTDKVGDVWHDGIFFDRQHPLVLQAADVAEVGYIPPFEATEIRLLSSHLPGTLLVKTTGGQQWEIEPRLLEDGHYRAAYPSPASATEIQVAACPDSDSCELQALTLVDERDHTFQPLVPGSYRLIHSGDVKIYENLDIFPRAFFVPDWQWESDGEAAFQIMRSPSFDPRETAVLFPQDADSPRPTPGYMLSDSDSVQIEQYLPEEIVLRTDSEQEGMLILADAHYPGWEAAIDGRSVPIYMADLNFRAVYVPPGSHQVVFSYNSRSFTIGLGITLAALAIVLIILGSLLIFRRERSA